MSSHEIMLWGVGGGLFGLGFWKTVRHWITHRTARLLDKRGRDPAAVVKIVVAADGRRDDDSPRSGPTSPVSWPTGRGAG